MVQTNDKIAWSRGKKAEYEREYSRVFEKREQDPRRSIERGGYHRQPGESCWELCVAN